MLQMVNPFANSYTPPQVGHLQFMRAVEPALALRKPPITRLHQFRLAVASSSQLPQVASCHAGARCQAGLMGHCAIAGL